MPESQIPPIAYLVLLIACLCIYGVIIDPTVTFAGMDFLNLNFPRVFLSRMAVSEGSIPLWNWNEWGGAPIIAPLQGAIFYPPTWLAWLCPLPYGLQLFIFCHIYAAGIGAMMLARKCLQISMSASIACGIFYMGCDFFPGRLEQFQIIAVNTLLPWLIFTTWRAWTRPAFPYSLAILWSLNLLAGHPQYAAFNILAALAVASIVQFQPALRPHFPIQLTRVAGALIFGTLIASIQLFPTWELSKLSERIWPYSNPTEPELNWTSLPALIIPHYYQFTTGQSGRVFGSTELGLYCGILALPLALYGLYHIKRSSHRHYIAGFTLIWLVAMVFALGKNAGLASFVFEYLPFFGQTRGAARSLNIASLMMALLAAHGLSLILHRLPPSKISFQFASYGFCALLTMDLAAHHYSPLRDIVVPVQVLSTKPLIPLTTLKNAASEGRIFRFMASDSDLYINDSTNAVAERIVRLQPNLTSLPGLSLVDGYEEGLLPVRTHANLFRKFNRNFRSDNPDASLLAFMGSNIMMTEFPLQPIESAWLPLSDLFPRPAIVPPVMANQTAYQFFKSHYKMDSLALDIEKLLPDDQRARFKKHVSQTFPVDQITRIPTGTETVLHPFTSITPEVFNAAQLPSQSIPAKQWNRYSISNTSSSKDLIVLIPPYPGWKISEKSSAHQLKSLCSLFYGVESNSASYNTYPIILLFEPFSFKLGLFFTLVSLVVLLMGIVQSWLKTKITNQNLRLHESRP